MSWWSTIGAGLAGPAAAVVTGGYQPSGGAEQSGGWNGPGTLSALTGGAGVGTQAEDKRLPDNGPDTSAPGAPAPPSDPTTPPPVVIDHSPPGNPAAAGAPTLNIHDPASVAAYVAYYASQPGANPSLRNDPNYWIQKISSGELGTDPNYIIGKFMTPEGAPAGAVGGIGTFSPDDPSYQWRFQQGEDAIQKSAAARGSLLTGGTLKDLLNYGQNAASQEYGAQFGRQYQLADLGFRATVAGGGAGATGPDPIPTGTTGATKLPRRILPQSLSSLSNFANLNSASSYR